MVEGRIGHQLLGRHRRLRHRRPPTPGAVMLDRARAEEADGRHADRRRHMHQTRIIPDEQAAAREAGGRTKAAVESTDMAANIGITQLPLFPFDRMVTH